MFNLRNVKEKTNSKTITGSGITESITSQYKKREIQIYQSLPHVMLAYYMGATD
jgi:hypothetical protein